MENDYLKLSPWTQLPNRKPLCIVTAVQLTDFGTQGEYELT